MYSTANDVEAANRNAHGWITRGSLVVRILRLLVRLFVTDYVVLLRYDIEPPEEILSTNEYLSGAPRPTSMRYLRMGALQAVGVNGSPTKSDEIGGLLGSKEFLLSVRWLRRAGHGLLHIGNEEDQ
jgi:hypothetical protein